MISKTPQFPQCHSLLQQLIRRNQHNNRAIQSYHRFVSRRYYRFLSSQQDEPTTVLERERERNEGGGLEQVGRREAGGKKGKLNKIAGPVPRKSWNRAVEARGENGRAALRMKNITFQIEEESPAIRETPQRPSLKKKPPTLTALPLLYLDRSLPSIEDHPQLVRI